MDDCCDTIKEDKLGFNNIYIQAKQWALNQTVGRPEIQKFVGALTGKQAQKGLFITTAKYSSEAIEYAGNLLGTKVVLINGVDLMKLMINHNIGVSIVYSYEVKRMIICSAYRHPLSVARLGVTTLVIVTLIL